MAFRMVLLLFPVAFAACPRVYTIGFPVAHLSVLVNRSPVHRTYGYHKQDEHAIFLWTSGRI
jgi:hypothetical protein